MAVSDIWMVATEFTHQGNANSYCNFFQVEAETDADAVGADLMAHMSANWTADLKPMVDTAFQLNCFTARQVWPEASLPGQLILSEQGSRTPADNLPGQCSAVATLYGNTVDPTKRNRGRDFWTGMQEGDQANGVLIGGPAVFKTLLGTYYTNRAQSFSGTGGNAYGWVVFSLTAAKAADPLGFQWGVALIRIRHLVRTQRRRQPLDPCEGFDDITPT